MNASGVAAEVKVPVLCPGPASLAAAECFPRGLWSLVTRRPDGFSGLFTVHCSHPVIIIARNTDIFIPRVPVIKRSGILYLH